MRYIRYEQKLLRDCFCGAGREDETKKALERYQFEMAQLKAGDSMYLGRFRVPTGGKPMDAEGPVMNILWRVLERRGNELILISEYVLDWEMFDDRKTRFKDSFLHMLLSSEYIEEWFTPEEQKLLCGEPDKIYLMTVENAKKYFPEPGSAKAYMMEACAGDDDRLLYTVEKYSHEWWLCTPGQEEGSVAYVTPRGDIDEEGFECFADEIGVRPMIRIDLSRIMDLFKAEAK